MSEAGGNWRSIIPEILQQHPDHAQTQITQKVGFKTKPVGVNYQWFQGNGFREFRPTPIGSGFGNCGHPEWDLGGRLEVGGWQGRPDGREGLSPVRYLA